MASPLGPDVLVLRRLSVAEAIGEPFRVSAEVISERADIPPAELLGQEVTCTVAPPGGRPERHFHGLVRAFTRVGSFARGATAYRIEAVPRLWQLSRTVNCRIFQDQDVRGIVGTLLDEHGATPVRWGAAVPSARRTYCVQFNESALEFAQRLLEEVGAGYFFEHRLGDHTMVVCGGPPDHPELAAPGARSGGAYVRRHDAADAEPNTLAQWRAAAGLRPGQVRASDFDGLKPSTLLARQTQTVLPHSRGGAFEQYRWPGGQAVRPDADPSRVRMEGLEADADLVQASANDPALFAGARVKVRAGIDDAATRPWLVTSVLHEAFDETHLVEGGGSGHRCSLALIPADRPWRPAAPRPRPAMAGFHSAIVTGPPGEEIHCDEYGRVKVRFLWDRLGKKDDTSSCWVRVAQSFAGAWGGSWQLPRVGDEVLVAFADADPDRPVILGSVYNAEQTPIYGLPANKTRSGIRTRSSKGGGASNFNELRFEDAKGKEEVHLQAEKDLTLLVKNNRTETVRANRAETVGGKHTETVKLDRSATVTQGNDSLLVKTGNISTKAALGKIEIEAMQSITLTCGGSKIHMTPMGVEITALTIKIDAKLALDTNAVLATHKAGALMTIKGALVMIN